MRLADRAHRVGREHPAAGALARARPALDLAELGLGHRAGGDGADGLEHARDVDRPAVVLDRAGSSRCRRGCWPGRGGPTPSASPACSCRTRPCRRSRPGARRRRPPRPSRSSSSRLTSEACIPSWPMEIPSDTVIVPNSMATPPALADPPADVLGQRAQRHVARRDLVPRVGDADLRLGEVVVGQPDRPQHRP